MGVYACFLISLLLIFQTVWISALSINSSSFEYGSVVSNLSNHSINSLPVQQHHQVLVSPREGGENRTAEGWIRKAEGWIISRARGGRSGGAGGPNNNHHSGKKKNAASNLLKPKITLLPTLLLTLIFC